MGRRNTEIFFTFDSIVNANKAGANEMTVQLKKVTRADIH